MQEIKTAKNANFYALIILIFLFIQAGAYGSSLEELLGSAHIAELKAGNRPTEIQFRNFNPVLVPRNAALTALVETAKNEINPNVMIETLFLFQKPNGADMTGWTAAEQTALYNELVAISSLQGIQYFSTSRNTMRTFYETSSVIDSPSTKRPLPDPVYAALPSILSLYAQQRDLTFGDNTYQYTYHLSPGSLFMAQKNITPMRYGIITAVGRDNLNSIIALLDAGDSILVYVVSMARTASFPGVRDRVGASFSTRAEAILEWISAGAERAFSRAN